MGINTDQILARLPQAAVRRDGAFHKRNFAKDIGEPKCKGLTARTPLRTFQTFVAFDTETTGIALTGNGVIEISAVRFVDFMPRILFTTLIHPQKPIPYDATAVNHITNEMVATAPLFYEIIPSLEFFLRDSPLIAHNAPFDIKHLYADGLDSIAQKKVYDTCALSRKMHPQQPDHKLGTCCAAHGIAIGNAHRAASDAMACGLLFVQFLMQHYHASDTNVLKQMMQ